MKKNRAYFVLLSLVCTTAFSQQTSVYSTKDRVYQEALSLYENQEYAAAQTYFRKVQATTHDEYTKSNSAYYIAQSAVRLNQSQAESLMTDFVERYPTHPKRNNAFVGAGNYYFSVGKYAVARKWYEDVNEKELSPSIREQYFFNKGYSLFKAKRFEDAQPYFEQVAESEKYKNQAQYYLGYIAYQSDDYDKADQYFNEVSNDEDYRKNLTYYNADRNFRKGNFQKAIEQGLEKLPTAKAQDKSELNKIIGESYFNLKDFENASKYLKEYKGKVGKWSNTDHYLLGYSYYKQGDYSNSVSEFNKIVSGRNSVAQNAYYHLADAYAKSGQKAQALNAFKNASEMSFDAIIKEDALYNYAKLSYEIGNSFESVPQLLTSYLTKYPNSDHKDEISEYLVDSYLSSKNFKAALSVMEKSSDKNPEIYQKVLYFRALELFKENNFIEAIKLFDKAIVTNADADFTEKSKFWKGESYYKLEDYPIAIKSYKTIERTEIAEAPELLLKDYQIGYSYFKLKKYKPAITHFKSFLETNPETSYKQDATLRLADSYFVSANYWPAMETYNLAIEQGSKKADYAHYQKAISYGFVNKNDRKIEDLERFISNFPNSTYKDDALYALANTYVAEGNTTKGVENYKRLQNELPTSSLVSKSLLKEGLIYYNGDQSEKSLTVLRQLVEKYPKSAESLQAVKTARLVYIDLGRTNEFAQWVKTLDFVEITNEDLDNDTFLAAENPYLENNYAKAIPAFENYLSQFPKGLHVLKSHFYLAQMYYKQSNSDKSLPHYEAVTTFEKNEYTETALYKTSQIYLEKKQYSKAIPFLIRLEKNADFEENIIFAKSNLMKSYYVQKLYPKTLTYANTVLNTSGINKNVKTDAQIYKARAAWELKNFEESKTAYAEVAKTATGKLGAEATYYNAYFANKANDYELSNTYVQQLASDYSAYREFGAKGLVLMAKNFYGLGDAYQATYVLESVIKNFSEYEKVVDEAQKELSKVKKEQSKVNSSIQGN